jgi:hypothetical protein
MRHMLPIARQVKTAVQVLAAVWLTLAAWAPPRQPGAPAPTPVGPERTFCPDPSGCPVALDRAGARPASEPDGAVATAAGRQPEGGAGCEDVDDEDEDDDDPDRAGVSSRLGFFPASPPARSGQGFAGPLRARPILMFSGRLNC